LGGGFKRLFWEI